MSVRQPTLSGPHARAVVHQTGPAIEHARGCVIFLHGRGADAQSILELYPQVAPAHCAGLAPQAAGYTWYPQSFLAPTAANEPYLSSALARIEALVKDLLDAGFESRNIALVGFSQGACLALHYAATHPRRYGAVAGLTGGLIGPPGTEFHFSGALEGTPVFLGTSDPDHHVPPERVKETATVLRAMGADVEMRIYADMPHTINAEELSICRAMLSAMALRNV